MLNCSIIGGDGRPPTWEHFVILNTARFGPQIMLGSGGGTGDIHRGTGNIHRGDDDNLVVGSSSGTLTMGADNNANHRRGQHRRGQRH
jgi:hypothetical protein